MIFKYKEYKTLLEVIMIIVLFLIFTYGIKNYFRPFIYIIICLMLGSPIYKLLDKLSISNNKIKGIICIVIINILFLSIIFFIGNLIVNRVYSFISKDYNEFLANIKALIDKFYSITRINSMNTKDNLNFNSGIINSSFIQKGAVYTTDSVLAYLIGNIAAYFILTDKYAIFNWMSKIIPIKILSNIRINFQNINKMIIIECILVLMTTLETIIGFWILGVNSPFMMGICCGLLDILPYVGTILIFIPLIITNLISKKIFTAIGLILLYVLLIVVRQIMEAKYMSNKLNVHPLSIILSLYIGIKLFGLIGLFMGPLCTIWIKQFVDTKEISK